MKPMFTPEEIRAIAETSARITIAEGSAEAGINVIRKAFETKLADFIAAEIVKAISGGEIKP